jgi:DNA-directed RNA polymerase subunit RPC12/RpoP
MPTTTTQTTKRIRMPEGGACPACSHRLASLVEGQHSIYRCAKCEAIYGSCYLGDSYSLVLPYMTRKEPPAGQIRYFNFDCIGSKGLTRRHGWYDPATKLIVQVG